MGFLRRLLGSKKQGPSPDKPHKRRWSFGGKATSSDKSHAQPSASLNHHFDPSSSSLDANKHAIAVAAATAAVAEAALAAAHAAAEVVRLTSSTSTTRPASAAARVGHRRLPEESAAVRIQSAFRGYLARRALRALKALVKLQALVRGHIVRKQTTDMLRRMQTLVRLQSQARASRAQLSENNMHSFKSSLSHYPVPEEYEHPLRAYSTKFDGSSVLKRCSSNANYRNSELERARFGSNWLNTWMEENASLKNDDEKSDKILEVDTWKPNFKSHHVSGSSFHTPHYYPTSDFNNSDNLMMPHESPSKRSSKAALNQSLTSLKFNKGKEESSSRTADNSPHQFSSSSRHSRRGPFTPTRSECSWGFLGGYAGHPNYMSNTESSRAKVRSQSAPRQRIEFDRYGYSRRTVQGLWDVGPTCSDRDSDLRNKGYRAPSSRFNRVGSANLR